MKYKIYTLFSFSFFMLILFLSVQSKAQSINLESIGKEKPLQVNGGLSANTVFSAGLPNIDKPFNYFLSANLNFNILNLINIPVSLNYTDRRVALSQGYSFNQFSISPSYKWATAHIGTNYMSFSPYTLNGHQFIGGGLELKPNKWNIQLMSGRLRKGQYEDTLNGPTFKRMGYGTKIEYNPGNFLAGITVFKSHDYASSVPETQRNNPSTGLITPEDNLVIALNFGTTLFHALQLNVEYSNSVITKDKSEFYEKTKIKSLAGLFAQTNATSESYNAFKTKLGYNIAKTKTLIGVGYEKIDPNYKTHGGYYFVNDIINYTANLTQSLLKDKLNLAVNIGVQKDDVKKTKASNSSRFIGAINANAQINEKLSMGLNFSNFQSYMFVNDLYRRITRVPGQTIDSLDFSMISQNFGYNLNKMIAKTDETNSGIMFNANFLKSQNKRDNKVDAQSQTDVLNLIAAYTHQLLKKSLSFNLGVNFISNQFSTSKMTGYGPTLSVQKGFLDKKLNTNINLTYLKTKNIGTEIQSSGKSATNLQIGANYLPTQKHNFVFNTGLVKSGNMNAYINGTLGYSYSF